MPSPIAHVAMGCAVYFVAQNTTPSLNDKRLGPIPQLLAVTTFFSLLPDVDSAVVC